MILQSPSQGWGSLLWRSLEFLVKENESCVSLTDTDRIPNILTAYRVDPLLRVTLATSAWQDLGESCSFDLVESFHGNTRRPPSSHLPFTSLQVSGLDIQGFLHLPY